MYHRGCESHPRRRCGDRSGFSWRDGSLAVGDEGIFRAVVPKIDAVNTVGCGDSMIAGFALGLSEGLSLEETLRRASAISAAAAMREETGFFVMEDMEALLPKIEIKRL